jgi:hypothetical protein
MRGGELKTSTRRNLLRWISVAAVASSITVFSAGTFAQAAPAPATIDVELTQIAGTNGTAQIPAGFPELGTAPWNAYNHYEVISTTKLSLPLSTKITQALVDGSTVEATLVPPPANATDKSNKVEVTLKDKNGATMSKGKYPVLAKGAKFLPVSVPYKTGNLVVAFKFL